MTGHQMTGRQMSGKDKIIDLKKGIRREVVKFIAGCILFALMAACTIISAVLLILNPGLDFPHGIWILAVGGVVLLWEMGRAFWVRSPLPEGYAAVSRADCPPLFSLIDEVAENLGVKLPEQIYVCPDASAAVFVMPGIQNLIRAPEDRYLVVGLGFLTQMDDEEIKSVLYHEFGHYVQAATDDSASVYVVGQFSRSFISGDKNEVSNIWQMNTCNQKLLFGYFALWICRNIRRKYSELSRQMEYDADDIAAGHVGREILQRTLVHAACIRYNFGMVRWGMKKLEAAGLCLEDFYQALNAVAGFSRPRMAFLKHEVIRRIERLGSLEVGPTASSVSWTVRDAVLGSGLISRIFPSCPDGGDTVLPVPEFVRWMEEGADIYCRHLQRMRSVKLEIHLDRRKHFLPLAEGIYDILIDGRSVGTGNFMKGYDIRKRISPGTHQLTVRVPGGIGIACDPFMFEACDGDTCRLDMDYRYEFKGTRYRVFVGSFSRTALRS